MKRILWIVAIATLMVSLVVALWVDITRIRWEANNKGFVAVVEAEKTEEITLPEFADAGINVIAIRASSLYNGRGPSPEEVHASGFEVALILDQSAPLEIADFGPFTYVWIEGNLPANDTLLITLLERGGSFILREFAPTSLARTLWESGFQRVVRGHEIPTEDLSETPRDALISRWERAVRERGIRVLLLTPIPGKNPVETFSYYRETIARITDLGYQSGELSIPLLRPNWPLAILFHLGISALLLLVLLRLFGHLPLACFLLAASVAAISLGVEGILLRQVDALLLALLAPVYGTLLLLPQVRSGWRSGVRLLVLFSTLSLSSCILLAAILSDPSFLVKIAEFRGVKVALLLPPLAGVILYYRQAGWEGLKGLLPSSRKLCGARLLGFGVLIASFAVAYFILIRSGNAESLVSGLEAKTRGILERLLVARPRFKEFLIGHPLLLLFGAGGWSVHWRPFPLFFGLIGQVSILNTFAHSHTPLLLSLLRTGNGLLLGLILGVGLYTALCLAEKGANLLRRRSDTR